MESFLTYDDRNMRITDAERRSVRKAVLEAHMRIEKARVRGEREFLDLPFDLRSMTAIARAARRVQKRFTHMIIVGIGGSDLGARTIWQALGGSKATLTFASNPDPESISHLLTSIDWKQTAMNVVSKSGTTLETMAIFMVLRESLIKEVGTKHHAEHIFVTTEPSPDSPLFQIATEEAYEVIPHPLNIGGRFSVLSGVGLFPAAVSGANVRRILAGARTAETERRERKCESVAARFALNQFISMTKYARTNHVLMAYADLLSQFGFWYRQIWAESLGKVRHGVSIGPTPIAAIGAIDQHSQIQLYNEGPDDKTTTFIEVERFRRSIRIPKVWGNHEAFDYIGGLSLERILHDERAGTEHALTMHHRPSGTLRIHAISPESLGSLFITFEAATAYMGELMGVNAYNQPGVEEGKREARRLLSR
ncbi:hypothetical protein A2348_02505 [Candidatus Uhrbacteria bacterium RIFOXYB12_FULL_58_10]|uniref:Glucose-6-phosphate isomerase n=1 Tax=Candidatus Uhrbacteria bacterium RIFOXYB2_FULL_57_15 TaxID=1802422 RepID=A0A1F7W5V3_9BACT|nr:MAG: hypothetical protein A2348_02505 [Candidatus Uhrbacteria bacterium RIFOXYB12_FULL_58_10]OGL98195.1 MAG: hypothetical protein A2304_03735 [Candidatus Uhrbacteria bacterium RIFOXYB2_FULL_57_15]OGL99169.1 MAG: hypothetical protein A2501_03150 [Candidatus Uhrbacteria bacterium RIFOXYC12_FULL_57_11]